MKTISISELKTHLSRELKKVKAGQSLMVTDHSNGVAILSPPSDSLIVLREAKRKFQARELKPLISGDVLAYLRESREDKW
jgi:antitoxin (DNA-binding transcriptional repressor) of toxin-antitoxin stability system